MSGPDRDEVSMEELISARDRLIGVMSELRGIWCDLESVDRSMERPVFAHERDEEINEALVPVVDLLCGVQRQLNKS